MFCDKIENLRKYAALCPRLAVVADFIEKTDIAKLPVGSVKLDDGVFVNIEEYETYPAPDKWEAHRVYADLHVMLIGDERMDGAPISNAEGGSGYNSEFDYEIFDKCDGPFASAFGTSDVFVWFGPEDAHRPGLRWNTEKVKKAIFKIPV